DNTSASRVQIRQTWNRSLKPLGNAEDIVYGTLKGRAQLDLRQCNMVNGSGGYMQLFDWDRSNSTETEQTMRVGYASYAKNAAYPVADVVRDGLCMLDWSYQPRVNLPAFTPPADRWPQALAQPWSVKPITVKRVAEDFDLTAGKPTLPEGSEGIFYANETTGWMHVYFPNSYVSVLDSAKGGLAIPIREVEQRLQFNDGSFNCLGRFRAEALQEQTQCDSANNQTNPQWGCKDDAACPPPNVKTADSSPDTGPGTAPGLTRGYFLIVDLERVYSSTLGSTLCISYPRESVSQAEGWSNTALWGKNCRGAPAWDPAAENDTGLPRGDWCSRTNSPATATCHDAYFSESYSTGQAFKIKDGTCGLLP
ncbi:MAG TPA: hypothetical protein VI072_11615, partial [Polyangiaceae bacterium]